MIGSRFVLLPMRVIGDLIGYFTLRFCPKSGIDICYYLRIRLLICETGNQPGYKSRLARIITERHDIQHLGGFGFASQFRINHGIFNFCHGVFLTPQQLNILRQQVRFHILLQTRGIDCEVTAEYRHHKTVGSSMATTPPSTANRMLFSTFGSVRMAVRIFFSAAPTVALIYRPPASPNSVCLYSGAITFSRYRSLPHRYRQVPRSALL